MIYESVSLYSVCAVQAVWPCDICAKKGTLLMWRAAEKLWKKDETSRESGACVEMIPVEFSLAALVA